MLEQIKKHIFLKLIRIILLTILFSLLISSCNQYAKFVEKKSTTFITVVDEGISKIEIQKWHVGPLRRQMLSKGIRLQITFPLLEGKNLQRLIDHYGVDSWIIRVKRQTFSGTKNIGYFYVPLTTPGRGKNKWRIRQLKKGFINIFYTAAAMSNRIARYACPAFDHRTIITKVQTSHSGSSDKTLSINKGYERYVAPKVTSFSYKPKPINGGSSLLGNYFVEIGIYRSIDKKRYSDFIKLPQEGEVVKERTKRLRGCKNFKPPKIESRGKSIHKFKFGN